MRAAIAIQPAPAALRRLVRENVVKVSNACSTCGLSSLCLPCAAHSEDIATIEHLVYVRKRVKRGEHLYRTGDPFHALYTFRTGFFKSVVTAEDGRTHVTGFQMPGEILGLDGIELERHSQDVIALEDAEVCVLPYAQLAEEAVRVPSLQHHLHRLMSREIIRDHGLMLLLGTMHADGRVAAFLLNLGKRFAERGYSSREFNLRMTREDIGSYLGLKLETVSRVLSRFHERGLVETHNRLVRIVDPVRLKAETAHG
jgi:CRP/FNR family transcriptional regulator